MYEGILSEYFIKALIMFPEKIFYAQLASELGSVELTPKYI